MSDDHPATDLSIERVLHAALVVIFEAAAILLIAWAVVYRRLALFGFIEMLVFVAFLTLGYYYARRRGAF